jgi:hypothetical protein
MKRFVLVLAGTLAAPAAAGPLTPTRPSDVVTLVNGAGNPCTVTGSALDLRVQPDGTRVPFAVPPGRVLVVTGIDFTTPDAAATDVELFVERPPDASQVFVTSTAGGGSASIPDVIVGSGSALCVRAVPKGGGASPVLAVVHGFLAKDK